MSHACNTRPTYLPSKVSAKSRSPLNIHRLPNFCNTSTVQKLSLNISSSNVSIVTARCQGTTARSWSPRMKQTSPNRLQALLLLLSLLLLLLQCRCHGYVYWYFGSHRNSQKKGTVELRGLLEQSVHAVCTPRVSRRRTKHTRIQTSLIIFLT